MKIFILSWHNIYLALSIVMITFLLLLLGTHLLSKLWFRNKSMKLDSQSVIVITGGCMGIGKLMAIELAKLYHPTIIIIDRKKDLFEEIANEIKEQNGICQCLYCDLADSKSVSKVLKQIKEHLNKIDFFIYNAGVFIPNLTWDATDEELKVTMNVNFFTPIQMVKEMLDSIEGGHIGIVSSVSAISQGYPQASAYIASKHATSAYFSTLRQQLKRYRKNITISIGCPYVINTTLFKGYKTYLPFKQLDAKYVAERLVKQFIDKKQVCYIGRKHAMMLKVLGFFPTFFNDLLCRMFFANNFPRRPLEQVTDRAKK